MLALIFNDWHWDDWALGFVRVLVPASAGWAAWWSFRSIRRPLAPNNRLIPCATLVFVLAWSLILMGTSLWVLMLWRTPIEPWARAWYGAAFAATIFGLVWSLTTADKNIRRRRKNVSSLRDQVIQRARTEHEE